MRTCEACGQLVRDDGWPVIVGDLKVIDEHSFFWKGERVMLSPVERLVTMILIRQPRQIITWGMLGREVNPNSTDPVVTSRTWISRTRAKFEAVDPNFDRIEAVYGTAGWRWEVIEKAPAPFEEGSPT